MARRKRIVVPAAPDGPRRWGRIGKSGLLGIVLSLPLAMAVSLPAGPALAAGVLPNGFTAKIVAYSGETISGMVNASGYDLGIYVGPGVHGVTIVGATVSGANDEGILVQDTFGVVIKDSTIEGNAVHPASLPELKAIVLGGTRDVVVMDNTVQDNQHGGIGIYDDGPSAIYAPVPIATAPVPSVGNVISHNLVKDNFTDCSIVLSAKNPGGGVYNDVISHNTIQGFDPAAGDFVPGVGGIIVAGGAFGAVTVQDNLVLDNMVVGGFLPGISVHATAGPGSIVDNKIIGNTLENNGGGSGSESAGVQIIAVPEVGGAISRTLVANNRVLDDTYGVYHIGDVGTRIVDLMTSGVPYPIYP
ncbi:MAG: right-handed parallel beta-helix repeat-containing protein [Clostridia bacterium]